MSSTVFRQFKRDTRFACNSASEFWPFMLEFERLVHTTEADFQPKLVRITLPEGEVIRSMQLSSLITDMTPAEKSMIPATLWAEYETGDGALTIVLHGFCGDACPTSNAPFLVDFSVAGELEPAVELIHRIWRQMPARIAS